MRPAGPAAAAASPTTRAATWRLRPLGSAVRERGRFTPPVRPRCGGCARVTATASLAEGGGGSEQPTVQAWARSRR